MLISHNLILQLYTVQDQMTSTINISNKSHSGPLTVGIRDHDPVYSSVTNL